MITSSVVEESVVTDRTESAAPEFRETMPGLVNPLIFAVSFGPGTLFCTQLPGVSQSPPLGAAVVFQAIVASSCRVSSISSEARLRLRPLSAPFRRAIPEPTELVLHNENTLEMGFFMVVP